MKKFAVIAAVMTLAVAAPVVAQSYDDTIEGYEATTVDMDLGKMMVVRIGIMEWTSDEDRQAMFAAFKESGSDGIAAFLRQQAEKGFVKFPDRPAYQMRYAHQFEKDGKRFVIMATDRPDKYIDTAPGSKTDDQPLTLLKLELDPAKGKGEGAMLFTAALTIDDDGKLTITTIGTQPTRFTKVTQKKPKQEKKKKG
ncbi:MAG: hypothetical protein R3344_04255 [Acidobacteriota bacterium]|nr:hypothetical protein [Acidobacteriota bacterium]